MKKLLFPFLFCLMGISHLWAQSNTYTRYTNLPAIYIKTFGNTAVTSKTTYIYGTMWYVDENDVVTRYDSLQIRGRGNSTWGLAKKPYRIKFKQKERLLGKNHANAKSWTLMANAGDKTMMRNAVTSAMGEFMGMDFCPAYKFVDLILNGILLGCYQVSDQVDVRPHRVDINEQDFPLTEESDITGGYLLEVDGFKEKNYFETTHKLPVRIHYPDEEEITKRQTDYIRSYIQEFENVLFSNDYLDPEKGYRPWVDSTSLAHLVIGNEVSANLDGYWSTYFYKDMRDPRLYWGPMWDYDIAYENDHRITGNVDKLMTDVGYGETKTWINRMWNDPWFTTLISRRYKELIEQGLVDHMLGVIDSLATLLDKSQQINYKRWGINTRMYHEIVLYSSYEQYVNDLRNFIVEHTDFLSTAFVQKSPTPAFVPQSYYYRIINKGTSTLLDKDGIKICGWNTDNNRYSQDWKIRKIGNYYHLTNRSNGMALNDPTTGEVGPTVNTGTQLNLVTSDTLDDHQLWLITPQGNGGYYNLTNKYTQHTANLTGGNAANGTTILSYTTDNRNASSNNRLWSIKPGDSLPSEIQTVEPDEYALAYNPKTQHLHFGSATPEMLTFTASIYSSEGRLMQTFRADEHCSVAHLPSGIYIVTWKCGGHTRSAKFQKP